MAVTGINSEDRLVQATFAAHLKNKLGWETVTAWNDETFGPGGALGRASTHEAVLTRDLVSSAGGKLGIARSIAHLYAGVLKEPIPREIAPPGWVPRSAYERQPSQRRGARPPRAVRSGWRSRSSMPAPPATSTPCSRHFRVGAPKPCSSVLR